MRSRARDKDPLLPVDFTVTGLLGLVLCACVAFGALVVFGPHDGPSACASEHVGLDLSARRSAQILDTAPGRRTLISMIDVCADQPSVQMRVYDALTYLTPLVFFVGTLILVRRLVRTARRAGVFDQAVVRRVGRLGVYLIVGGLVTTFVQAMAAARLLELLVPSAAESRWLGMPDWLDKAQLHVAVLLTGIAMVSVARIVRAGTGMRQELDATI